MKTVILFLLLLMAAWSARAADLDKERASILAIDKQWLAAVAEGRDVERIVSFWSDDAKVLAPGMPAIEGKAAIRKFVQESLAMPGFSLSWDTHDIVVSNDGALAYATATNLTTFNDAQGNKVTAHGKAVTVWRKDASGAWKCIIDIWNDVPAGAK